MAKPNRLDPVLYCDDPSLTRQSEADATDINKIVALFDKTGMMPQVPPGLYSTFRKRATTAPPSSRSTRHA